MKWAKLLIPALLLVAVPVPPGAAYGGKTPAGVEELRLREELSEKFADLLARKQFAELDRLAEQLRKNERTPSGLWKLDLLYSGICPDKKNHNQHYWEMSLDQFRQWSEQRPDSITAPIGLAGAWIAYAWQARGSGLASTVTETGWKLFRERLEKAYGILAENSKKGAACPRWHREMIHLARVRSRPRPEAWELLKASAAAFPDYWESYFQMAACLQPRWGGRPGEMLKMADWAAEHAGGELGKEIYARICWAVGQSETARDFLSPETGVDWEKMKAGFEVMMKKYPGSDWNRAAFCYFAWLFQDKPVVRELFPGLDRRLLMEFWPDWKSMNEARAWIESKDPISGPPKSRPQNPAP